MELPEIRDFGWRLKGLETGFSNVTVLTDGRTLFEVRHSPVRNVTAEMLCWWYGVYADLKLIIDGEEHPAFLVSHPQDHISLSSERANPDGPLMPGDFITILEAYQRDLDYVTSERIEVVQRNTSRYLLRSRRGGMPVAEVEFTFEDGPDGAVVRNTLTVGLGNGFLKGIVNGWIVPWIYDEDRNYGWVKHSIEEIGNFENFLPDIFARRDQGMTIRWDRNKMPT